MAKSVKEHFNLGSARGLMDELILEIANLRTELTALRTDVVNVRASLPGILAASETYDAGSIADGDEEVGEVIVTGAVLGDFCIASHGVDVADLAITGAVTAADTVTYQLLNNTGGAIDLASATVRVLVIGKGAVATAALTAVAPTAATVTS